MSDEHDKRPDPRLTEEKTIKMVRARKPPPTSSEPATRRMVRDAALDAAIRGELPEHEEDSWEGDLPEEIPELAGTARMPAHVERRALPFRRRDGGGRHNDPSLEAPFTGGAASTPAAWLQGDGDPSLDASQLPSALAPRDLSSAPVRAESDDEGSLFGVAVALGVFVLLALALVAVAAFGV